MNNSADSEHKDEWARSVLLQVRKNTGLEFRKFPERNLSPMTSEIWRKHNAKLDCLQDVIQELNLKYSCEEKNEKSLEEWSNFAYEEVKRRLSIQFPEETEKPTLSKKKLYFPEEGEQFSEASAPSTPNLDNVGNYIDESQHSPVVKELVTKYESDARKLTKLMSECENDSTPKRIPRTASKTNLSLCSITTKDQACQSSFDAVNNRASDISIRYPDQPISPQNAICQFPFLADDKRRLKQINIQWAKDKDQRYFKVKELECKYETDAMDLIVRDSYNKKERSWISDKLSSLRGWFGKKDGKKN